MHVFAPFHDSTPSRISCNMAWLTSHGSAVMPESASADFGIFDPSRPIDRPSCRSPQAPPARGRPSGPLYCMNFTLCSRQFPSVTQPVCLARLLKVADSCYLEHVSDGTTQPPTLPFGFAGSPDGQFSENEGLPPFSSGSGAAPRGAPEPLTADASNGMGADQYGIPVSLIRLPRNRPNKKNAADGGGAWAESERFPSPYRAESDTLARGLHT